MENFEQQNRYLKAKEQVAEIKKFYGSLVSYILVISALGIFNYYVDGLAHPWFLWAAAGWSIGLIFQAGKAFNWNPLVSKEWEERKIKEYMEREERSQSGMGRWE